MHPQPRTTLAILLFMAGGLLFACGGGNISSDGREEALIPVRVQLSWTHQVSFAGYYSAEENGEYAAEGLSVTLIEGGGGVDWLEPVLYGGVHFGVANSEALIQARANGAPVTAIAVINRRSPAVYMTMAESGITRPEDFKGKVIETGSSGLPRLHAIMARVGIDPDEYTAVDWSPGLDALYAGEVDVRNVYVTNEVPAAKRAGYEVNVIYPSDYGINVYNDVIFTTDDLIAQDPDLVLRYLRATLKGFSYAVEHPDAMGTLVLQYNPAADAAVQNETMRASVPLIRTGQDDIGWMEEEVWAGTAQVLYEQDVLMAPLDVTEIYTMDFLKAIYQSGQ